MVKQSVFGANVKALRIERGLSQEKLAELIGVTKQTVFKWENSVVRAPRQQDVLDSLCRVLGTTEDELLGYSDGFYSQSADLTWKPSALTGKAPVLGRVAAGDPREAIEEVTEMHDAPAQLVEKYPHGFFLRVAGDSMNLVLPDGAYVFINAVPDEVHSGDIAAVKVNGDDATIKRVQIYDGIVVLQPESTNPEHKRRIIDETNPDSPEVRILGKAMWVDYALVKF